MSDGRISHDGRAVVPAHGLRVAYALLAAAVLLEVAFIFLFSPFVTNDTAMHLGASASLIDTLGGWDLGTHFLEWNLWPVPNILTDLFLAVAIDSVGVEWAERAVLVGYVVALPLATLYAVRSGRRESVWLAFFALPVTFSLTFLYGFLNFSYSLVTFLVAAGFLLRTGVRMTASRTAALSALLLLAFFTHFVGYLAACLLVIIVLGTRAVFFPLHRRTIVLRAGTALVPSAALALAFVASSESATVADWDRPTRSRVEGLLTLTWGIVSYDNKEKLFCGLAAAAAWGLIILAVVRRRAPRERDPDTLALAIFALSVALVELLAPDAVGSGGSFLTQRLALFPLFGVLMWLARQDLRRTGLMTGAAVAVVAALGLAGVRYDELRQIERIAHDQTSVIPCVEEDATIVQANLARVRFGSAARIETLTSETGRIAAAREGLDLANYNWELPFSLQRFRAETNPYEYLAVGRRFDRVPPALDFRSFEQASGAPADVVLLWARPEMTDATRNSNAWRRFDRSLRARYHLFARSPLGWWEVWTDRTGECSALSNRQSSSRRRGVGRNHLDRRTLQMSP